MKKRMFLLILAALFLVSCAVPNDNKADVKSSQLVPGWLLSAVKAEFQKPELVSAAKINVFQVHMKQDDQPQILAYINLDRLNGVMMIFEKQEDGYKVVYKKNGPVYNVQVIGGGNEQLIVYTSGFGGTGMQENYFYILGSSADGFKELWKGIAEKFVFAGLLPYSHIQGAINFDISKSKMLYTQYIRTYNSMEYDINKPSTIETKTYYFEYKTEQQEFVLVDTR